VRKPCADLSPRPLYVFEPHEAIGGIDGHTYRIEADCPSRRPWARFIAQPRNGKPAKPRPLATAQPFKRLPIRTEAGGPGPQSLDLGEHERLAVEGDQVDLTRTGAYIACERGEAEPREMRLGQLLAVAAQRASSVDARDLLARRSAGTLWVMGETVNADLIDARSSNVTRNAQVCQFSLSTVTIQQRAPARAASACARVASGV
jgi:hypothetical protein